MSLVLALPRIALTPGEPAGIGPDLCVQLAQLALPCQLIVVADPQLLRDRAKQLNLELEIDVFDPTVDRIQSAGRLTVMPVALADSVRCGELNPANSAYVLDCIRQAVIGCLHGQFAALVTGPVHKGVINAAGFSFSGHTEFIAELSGAHPVMMLATPGLRVALVTTHLPLAQVSAAITRQTLSEVIRVLDNDLRLRFGVSKPKILVCGLNPHAGENGYLGREEIDVIEPVLQELRAEGMDLRGPLPADTLFTPKYLDHADAVLAMYHDQGLPVLKYKGFGEAVNITLGLPLIRTSVDHGTALDLAGSGLAHLGSLQYALKVALDMAAAKTI